MKSNLSHAIIKTLCYAEVFSYPLTFLELHKYLIYHKKVSKQELLLELHAVKDILVQQGEYLTFKNMVHLSKIRRERNKESRRKYKIAILIANLLSYIPSIKLIGISGSLSMFNSKTDDDIDFFFITSKNTLWITRLVVTTLLVCFKQKRDRVHAITKDRICLNMFLSEQNLSLPSSSRSLYTAHEVSQLKIIYVKDQMDKQFLSANKWALRYLPNAFKYEKQIVETVKFSSFVMFPFELIAFGLQYAYMKKRITNERIGLNFAMFHPRKSKEIIQDIYGLKVAYRLHAYGLQKNVSQKHHEMFVN